MNTIKRFVVGTTLAAAMFASMSGAVPGTVFDKFSNSVAIVASAAESNLYTDTVYYIKSGIGDLYLTANGTQNGATLSTEYFTGSDSQKWTLEIYN